MIFEQGAADSAPHTLFVDEVRIENASASAADTKSAAPAPKNLQARAYERHVDLTWDPTWNVPQPHAEDNSVFGRFIIYRSFDGSSFEPIGMQTPGVNHYTDVLGKVGQKAHYKVIASDANYRESAPSEVVSTATHSMTADEFLPILQKACSGYNGNGAHRNSELIREI